MIRFENVSKHYENQTALKDINLKLGRGEMAFITGPSGAGKSTLLKLIYLSERPDEGSLVVDDVDLDGLKESRIPELRRKIGVVFQDFRLLHRPVFENVALALRVRGISDKDVKPAVYETLKMVNLRHKADSLPSTLSGGEQQRIAIARAIIGEPVIVLADEPTGNLDSETASGIMAIFKEINARGATVLIATHNRELYANTGRRVFALDAGSLKEGDSLL